MNLLRLKSPNRRAKRHFLCQAESTRRILRALIRRGVGRVRSMGAARDSLALERSLFAVVPSVE